MKKLGFSLLLAFLMLGIFAASASAQAYDPYNWNQELIDDQGNKFVYEDSVKYVIKNVPGTVEGEPKTSWFYHEYDEVTSTWVLVKDADGNNRELDIITNANDTTAGGSAYSNAENFDNVIKSTDMIFDNGTAGTHRTHTAYQNNTNSCASCHQTHTAQSKNLLFADSVYQTCAACHDGTLGFYNVFQNGEEYFASETTGGTFGGSHSGNMSVHLVNGAMQIKAAPGGNQNGEGAWTNEFTCASCHAPHGSYSDRLLHYNPNNMGNTAPDAGGIKAEMVIILDTWTADNKVTYDLAIDGEIDTDYVLVRGTKAQHAIVDDKIAADAVVAMLYKVNEVRNDDKILTGYTFTKNANPWLYGYGARGGGSGATQTSHAYYTRFFVDEEPVINDNGTILKNKVVDYGTTGVYFKFDKGYAYSTSAGGKTALEGVQRADVGRAYKVGLQLNPIAYAEGDPRNGVVTKHNVNAMIGRNNVNGIAAAAFCSSCHTDYLAGSGKETGTFNTAYRHTTDNGSYTCLLCHYAHGTDVEIMLDAQSRTVFHLEEENSMTAEDARAYMLDKNPSSALKKFTNMSGCWACHNSSKAETLRNTNRESGHPTGYITDPSQVFGPYGGTNGWND